MRGSGSSRDESVEFLSQLVRSKVDFLMMSFQYLENMVIFRSSENVRRSDEPWFLTWLYFYITPKLFWHGRKRVWWATFEWFILGWVKYSVREAAKNSRLKFSLLDFGHSSDSLAPSIIKIRLSIMSQKSNSICNKASRIKIFRKMLL